MFELHFEDIVTALRPADEPPIHARAVDPRSSSPGVHSIVRRVAPGRVVKITGVTTYLVGNRWKNWLFVRVDTDEGIHGLGEGSLNGFCRTVEAAVHEFDDLVVGRVPVRPSVARPAPRTRI